MPRSLGCAFHLGSTAEPQRNGSLLLGDGKSSETACRKFVLLVLRWFEVPIAQDAFIQMIDQFTFLLAFLSRQVRQS